LELNIDTKDEMDRNMLHHCVSLGWSQLASVLLEKGINVNAIDIFGCSPLHLAVLRGKLRTIKVLLDDSRTDTNVVDKGGNSALDLASLFEENHIFDEFIIRNETKTQIQIITGTENHSTSNDMEHTEMELVSEVEEIVNDLEDVKKSQIKEEKPEVGLKAEENDKLESAGKTKEWKVGSPSF